MKKFFFALLLLLGFSGSAWGLTYTGSISNGNGLYGTAAWSSNALLSWLVAYDAETNLWTYTYTFSVNGKSPSHEIIEVSSGDSPFTSDNIKDYTGIGGTGAITGPGTFTPQDGNSNPGMPGNIYGIKWGSDSASGFTDTWTLLTDRQPMWGDFYSKDGKDCGAWVLAYNTGFGHDTESAIGNGNAFDQATGWAWALVPDSESTIPPQEQVPEPGTIMLLGGGLLGLAIFRGRRAGR
jgi:hypothetical protein